jgi:uncharacterized protein (TIGR03067 family)
MIRVLGPKFIAVACVVFLTATSARAEDKKPAKVPDELQGVWQLIKVEVNGEANDPLGGGSPRWVVKGDKISYGGEEIIQLTADAFTTPRVIDLTFRDPERTFEGIYVVEKGKLKVCLNKRTEGAKDRPDAFETKDKEERVLLIFEKEKAAPANATDGLKAFAGIVIRNEDDKPVIDAPIKGSPAEKAGLKKGDIVVKVGTTDATDLPTVVKAVREAKPGEKLDFRVTRDGKEVTVTVKVGVLPFHWAAGLNS